MTKLRVNAHIQFKSCHVTWFILRLNWKSLKVTYQDYCPQATHLQQMILKTLLWAFSHFASCFHMCLLQMSYNASSIVRGLNTRIVILHVCHATQNQSSLCCIHTTSEDNWSAWNLCVFWSGSSFPSRQQTTLLSIVSRPSSVSLSVHISIYIRGPEGCTALFPT